MNLKITTALLAFTLMISLVALVPASVLSQGAPCVPNRFYGNALANVNPAPTGLTVTAEVNGVETSSVITVDGKYGYVPYTFDVLDNDNNCDNGGVVEFFINGQPAGSSPYNNGYFTLLDLSATGVSIPQPPAPPTDGGTGGGGGGGGGGYITCTPQWSCSDWSQCIGGSQDRECIDINQCGTEEGKPPETQSCGIESILPENCTQGQTTCVGSSVWECVEEGTWQRAETCENECSAGACAEAAEASSGETGLGEGFPITGLDIFAPSTLPYWAILIIVIIVVLYLIMRGRGTSPKAKETKK